MKFISMLHNNINDAASVTLSFLTSAAKNFGFEQQTEHDERYLRAEEYVTSVSL